MLGDAVLNAASRATHNALENVSRRVTWMALAALFLASALVFGLILTFWVAEPRFGPLRAAAGIAAVCFVVGLICASMPSLIERAERPRRVETAAAKTSAVVDAEAKEAVDYFGAIRVVGAAFLFGLGAARRLKG
jgi:hypothetical protein